MVFTFITIHAPLIGLLVIIKAMIFVCFVYVLQEILGAIMFSDKFEGGLSHFGQVFMPPLAEEVNDVK